MRHTDAVMKLTRGTGSILDADVEGLVNPVNCVGVMGKGLALAFKKKFPDVFREYKLACDEGRMVPGRVQVVTREGPSGPKVVFNFPTKRHWREGSRLEDIESGLVDLSRQILASGITSIAVPALGCGLGGLEWTVVRKLVVDHLHDSLAVRHDFELVVFEPQ